jgi:hypothetical protein
LFPDRRSAGGVPLLRPRQDHRPRQRGHADDRLCPRVEPRPEERSRPSAGTRAAKGWRHEVTADLGSRPNYHKKGLNRLLELILPKRCGGWSRRTKDRLLHFGSELIFAPCEIQNVGLSSSNKGEPPSFEEELAQEVIEITTVFSAQLYSRSHKTKRLLNELSANGDNVTEPDIITKSRDVSEAVRPSWP